MKTTPWKHYDKNKVSSIYLLCLGKFCIFPNDLFKASYRTYLYLRRIHFLCYCLFGKNHCIDNRNKHNSLSENIEHINSCKKSFSETDLMPTKNMRRIYIHVWENPWCKKMMQQILFPSLLLQGKKFVQSECSTWRVKN